MKYPLLAALVLGLHAHVLPGQVGGSGADGDLVVTKASTLSSDRAWNWKSLRIQAGATLRFEGKSPAVLRVQGAVDIRGTLSVEPRAYSDKLLQTAAFLAPQVPGAGGHAGTSSAGFWVLLGRQLNTSGMRGAGPGAGGSAYQSSCSRHFCNFRYFVTNCLHDPSPASHRGTYGSDLPFSLTGGSGGANSFHIDRCKNRVALTGGGGSGGGAIAILCDDKIRVAGTISARALDQGMFGTLKVFSEGSSGSILLRAMKGVVVDRSAVVTAGGPRPGYVRIDSYDVAASIAGVVTPPPRVMTLPALSLAQAPKIGDRMKLLGIGLPKDVFVVLYSWGTARLTIPPFGDLLLDLNNGFLVAGGAIASASEIDAIANWDVPVHNATSLVGKKIHIQALNLVTRGRPRFTNRITTTFQR